MDAINAILANLLKDFVTKRVSSSEDFSYVFTHISLQDVFPFTYCQLLCQGALFAFFSLYCRHIQVLMDLCIGNISWNANDCSKDYVLHSWHACDDGVTYAIPYLEAVGFDMDLYISSLLSMDSLLFCPNSRSRHLYLIFSSSLFSLICSFHVIRRSRQETQETQVSNIVRLRKSCILEIYWRAVALSQRRSHMCRFCHTSLNSPILKLFCGFVVLARTCLSFSNPYDQLG